MTGSKWAAPILLGTLLGGGLLAQQLDDRRGEGAIPSALVPLLAGWLETSRDAAIARGVERIPQEIRNTLSGFVPPRILGDVRWRIDGDASLAGRGLFAVSSAYAITLDNVIIFAGPDEASDPGLWAHEIYHVMQYDEWGIDGFLTRYLADRHAVEKQAKEFRYQWWKATETTQ